MHLEINMEIKQSHLALSEKSLKVSLALEGIQEIANNLENENSQNKSHANISRLTVQY